MVEKWLPGTIGFILADNCFHGRSDKYGRVFKIYAIVLLYL